MGWHMYPDGKLPVNFENDDEVGFFSPALEPLNTWSAHRVEIWGQIYPTVEHAYHSRKYDGDSGIQQQVLAAGSPWAAMRVDRAHIEKRRADWDEVKTGFMRELLQAKLAQHEDVQERLVSTGTKRIVETSPVNSFWGWGPDHKGKNMIGELWMELRANL